MRTSTSERVVNIWIRLSVSIFDSWHRIIIHKNGHFTSVCETNGSVTNVIDALLLYNLPTMPCAACDLVSYRHWVTYLSFLLLSLVVVSVVRRMNEVTLRRAQLTQKQRAQSGGLNTRGQNIAILDQSKAISGKLCKIGGTLVGQNGETSAP